VTLGGKLALVFLGFLAILVVVILVAFRERRRGRDLADNDVAGQQAQDARVLAIIFGAMLGGLLLTLLVAWMVFL
jgi:hypothetical protein